MSWNANETNTPDAPRPEKPAAPAITPFVFSCSICGEPSKDICVACTKDACENHRCLKCLRCSDCCACEFARA